MKALSLIFVSLLMTAGLSFAQIPEGLLSNDSNGTAIGALLSGQQSTGPEMKLTGSASVSSYKEGESFYLLVKGEATPEWHAYFRNPGTVGEPMTVELHAPAGFEISGPYWSAPERHVSSYGSVAYSYEHPTIVWKITPKADAPQQANFSVTTNTQLCSDSGCSPAVQDMVEITLTAGDGAAAPDWQANTLQMIAGLTPAPQGISATQTDKAVTLSFPAGAVPANVHFFSYDNAISPTAEQKIDSASGTLTLPRNDNGDSLHPVKDTAMLGKALPQLSGVLVADGRAYEISLPMAAEAKATAATAEKAAPVEFTGGMGALFLSLFIGGLILNLMPCVFPVIGLKIMSFVELGGGSRRKVFMHSLAFVLGILISFWIISALLIIFSNLEGLANQPWTQWLSTLWNDTGSGNRSWAAWMQNEWIVYLILLLLLTLGLSMFGVFEIGVGATSAGQSMQNKSGLVGSFFQGLFVTVVATPCSAPFLGAAMPAAMAQPGVWMMLALTFMALGLAFPYILLGIFPSLVKYLPRPGAWMESLKQGLSFLLFAAAAWILYVYLAFIPAEQQANILWVLVGLVVFSAAFWVYGRWCPMYKSMRSRIIGLVVALLLAAGGVFCSMPTPQNRHAEDTHTTPVWVEWSDAAMQQALDEGKPVFVDFTAKWCATCLANKSVAYTDEVYEAFRKGNVVLMRADKTRPSPAIDEAMRKLNRSSVPVNALYLPDAEPAITIELLTPGYMLEFLSKNLPQTAVSPQNDNADNAGEPEDEKMSDEELNNLFDDKETDADEEEEEEEAEEESSDDEVEN
ncbi:MAG: thioredoxin family protein [Akkermansia sp.]|nr:thioredoxin family protein [Akkermansia sp.]